MTTKKFHLASFLLIAGVLACNMPTLMPPGTQTDPALTITALAMTIQAQDVQLLSTAPPANTPLPLDIPTSTLTPTLTFSNRHPDIHTIHTDGDRQPGYKLPHRPLKILRLRWRFANR